MSNNNTAQRKKILYFDCYSGISGDMTLGALLDLGVDLKELNDLLSGLKLEGYRLEAEKVNRGAIAGTRAMVWVDGVKPVQRNLSAILRLIDHADLPAPVKEKGRTVFINLAEAEAKVHNIPVEEVHFHEVGAVDAIIDIVGACAALYLLKIDSVGCSPLPAGRGEVDTAHGRLPLPAPATLELLAKRNAPISGSDHDFELITPTGAALVSTIADFFGSIPVLNIEAIGYGAGSIDPGYPNFLRLILGFKPCAAGQHSEDDLIIIETNIDDLNPEILGYLMERLFKSGALDVSYTPIQMKKNRPAVQLTVLAPPEQANKLQDLIFFETSTLGLRLISARKISRHRDIETVQTEWGPVKIKSSPALAAGYAAHHAPEYEDCYKIAVKTGLPLKEVYRIVLDLFNSRQQ